MWRIQFHIIGNGFVRSRVLVVIRRGRRVGRTIARNETIEAKVVVEVVHHLARCVLHHSRSDLLRCIVGLCERTLDRDIDILRRDDAVALRRKRCDPCPEGEVGIFRTVIGQRVGHAVGLSAAVHILLVILGLLREVQCLKYALRCCCTTTHRSEIHRRTCDVVLDIIQL